MSPRRARLVLAGLLALGAMAACPVDAAGWEDMTVGVRWDTVWLSPRLKGNWVNLLYANQPDLKPVPAAEVVIDLPATVRCVWAYGVKFHESPPVDGRHELVLEQVPLDGSTAVYLMLASQLPVGSSDRGSCRARWEGGQTAATEFAVKVIDVPVARQPKQLLTGAAIWPYMVDNWPDFQQQYASMGFNSMDLWHGAIHVADRYAETPPSPALAYVARLAESNAKLGIMTAIDSSAMWDDEIVKADPDAQALLVDGTRSGPCPSYRGPGFTRAIARNAAIAHSGISWIQSDEETYGSGGFTTACVCPRCEARWREWLRANRPDLAYLPAKTVIAERDSRPGTWRAWLWFRASLTTERYQILKRELERAVAQTKAKSSPRPMLSWWAAAADDYTLLNCMQDARSLASVLDVITPQLYFRYGIPPRRFRDLVRRQCWAVGGDKTCAGIDSEDPCSNVPGDLTAAVLETLFAGGRGYCMWLGARMDPRQWAELAAVNDVIARHENTFLTGHATEHFRCFPPEGKGDYFHPWSGDVFATTWENATTGLLLLSDYRAQREPLMVERSRRQTGAMVLRDAFTGQTVANLRPNQWEFSVSLPDGPVRFLTWDKTSSKR